MYDSAGDRGASDAEGDCAVDKDDPGAENDCYGLRWLDTDKDADATLAVYFEHFSRQNRQNFSPSVVKIRLFRFFFFWPGQCVSAQRLNNALSGVT